MCVLPADFLSKATHRAFGWIRSEPRRIYQPRRQWLRQLLCSRPPRRYPQIDFPTARSQVGTDVDGCASRKILELLEWFNLLAGTASADLGYWPAGTIRRIRTARGRDRSWF